MPNISRKSVNGVLVEHSINGIPQPLEQPNIVANALRAGGRIASAAIRGQNITVSGEEKERRLAICRGCDFFIDNPLKCRKCGCYLHLKMRLETEHCPINEW